MLCQEEIAPKIINKWKEYHIIINRDHYRKSGSWNLSVASIYCIAEPMMVKIVEKVKSLSPCKQNL